MQACDQDRPLWRALFLWLSLVVLWGTASGGELVTYYHNDVTDSPVAATDAKGYYIWRASYEPYGQRIQNGTEYAASIDNDRWFTSHVEDVETGTIYMQARHYDPGVGRFMSVDPVRFTEAEPHTFTRYAYAANSPYRYTDPDGEFINFIVGGVKAAVENVAIQHIEMALGTRDSFSWGELALETAVGTATSGLSTIKNAARVANIASDVASKADEGIVYLRKGPSGERYVGQAKSDERFLKRQGEHNRKTQRTNTYEILGYAKPGKDLDVLEETHIRRQGGLPKDGGSLENKRYQMSDENYKKAGGTESKPQKPAQTAPPPPPPPPVVTSP